MPAPTNTSAATAIDLGALPVTYTQDVNFGGQTFEVWTKFTATQTGVVGTWAYGTIGGDGSSYQAEFSTWNGPASSPVFYPENQGTAFNVPALMPVTAGVTYYQQIQSQHGNVATV
jgi:hypothetical protein